MKKLSFVLLISILVTGCASVKMEEKSVSEKSKQFATPSPNNSGLYIYRDSPLGASLKKDIWVDGKCIGESVPKVFFYTEVSGNAPHTISTESEFSPNHLKLMFDAGKNYFIRQYIKFGVFVGGADLEVMPESEGKTAVANLDQAVSGICSEQTIAINHAQK